MPPRRLAPQMRERRTVRLPYLSGILGVVLLVGSLSGLVSAGASTPSAAASAAADACATAYRAANPVAAENQCPGTRAWYPDHPAGTGDTILGFAAPASVNVGELVQFYITTTAPTYEFRVYRLGWYQGLGARLMYASPPIHGIHQPDPNRDPVTHLVSCANWRNPIALPVSPTWISGIYAVKLLTSTGFEHYLSFVVRNDASRSLILFQSGVLTFQAYNQWGGYDLYYGQNPDPHAAARKPNLYTARAYVVSFDRPMENFEGLGDVVRWEYDLVRWLERAGYDLSYTTDVDVDLRGDLLTRHRLLLVGGHAEYWSTAMRVHVAAARDAGVSLAFFGANDIYWHVRMLPSALGPDREVVCYKVAPLDPLFATDPSATTGRWRDKPLLEPESAVLGQQFAGILRADYPLQLAPGARPFLQGTGLAVGGALPGLVGDEYDQVYANTAIPAGLVVVAASAIDCSSVLVTCPPGGKNLATATLYTAPSGAHVFDAGTLQWNWGLDDAVFGAAGGGLAPPRHYSNPGFQRLTANLLAYLLSVR